MITPDIAPAPSPDLADAAIVRRAEPLDFLLITRSYQGGMSSEEVVLCFPCLPPAEVRAVIDYSCRHPEEMEDYLSGVMEMKGFVYINVDVLRARRQDRRARVSARRDATQQEERDGDAQDESQAVAPARRRAAAHPRQRSGGRRSSSPTLRGPDAPGCPALRGPALRGSTASSPTPFCRSFSN